jgi:hypothetical protein
MLKNLDYKLQSQPLLIFEYFIFSIRMKMLCLISRYIHWFNIIQELMWNKYSVKLRGEVLLFSNFIFSSLENLVILNFYKPKTRLVFLINQFQLIFLRTWSFKLVFINQLFSLFLRWKKTFYFFLYWSTLIKY